MSGVYVQQFKKKWKDLKSIILIENTVEKNQGITKERRYYISSLAPDAEKISQYVRGHWCVENQCHWVLDVAFMEDHCRTRVKNSAANFSVLRAMVLNLLTKDKVHKVGKKQNAKWRAGVMNILRVYLILFD